MKDEIPDPNIRQELNFLHLLAKVYEAWDLLDFIPAYENMDILQNKEIITALMFTMCQNALVREEQEKYDMATLLFYRLLEMIEQRRLARYNLYVSTMNYKTLKYDTKQCPDFSGVSDSERFKIFKEKIHNIKKELFSKM